MENSGARSRGLPYVGMFSFDRPVLLLRDLIKNLLLKDFSYFPDKGFTGSKNDPLFGEALFSLKGQYWKDVRAKLSPAFSSGKMKRMFLLVEEQAAQLDHYFDDAADTGNPVNIKDVLAKFTTDVVSSVGFGIKTNALINPDDDFRRFLSKTFLYSPLGAIKVLAMFAGVPFLRLINATVLGTEISNFMRDVIWKTVQYRKETGHKREDFLDLLIQLKDKGNVQEEENKPDEVPDMSYHSTNFFLSELCSENICLGNVFTALEGDTFVSQAFIFLAAGFETSSSTMSFCLYHLALESDIQQRVREDILEAVKKNDGQINYQVVHDLPYLDMVLAETLRLYPIMPFLDRTCVKPYQVPGTNLVLDKDVMVYISLMGIHKDPEIYPDPEKFNPENFSEQNKQKRHKFAHLPFGEGPRVCIGMRFGLMQAKVGLAHILLNYEVKPCSKTPASIKFDPHTFLLTSEGDIPLCFNRIQY
ncbi:cytochrome P450 6k1 [Anabrus simplex]|uniref:cytochrome P450 6k1 n=1 Tax=Anabrus simplex TaxID=316456 RepID=UPI0035A3134B